MVKKRTGRIARVAMLKNDPVSSITKNWEEQYYISYLQLQVLCFFDILVVTSICYVGEALEGEIPFSPTLPGLIFKSTIYN